MRIAPLGLVCSMVMVKSAAELSERNLVQGMTVVQPQFCEQSPVLSSTQLRSSEVQWLKMQYHLRPQVSVFGSHAYGAPLSQYFVETCCLIPPGKLSAHATVVHPSSQAHGCSSSQTISPLQMAL